MTPVATMESRPVKKPITVYNFHLSNLDSGWPLSGVNIRAIWLPMEQQPNVFHAERIYAAASPASKPVRDRESSLLEAMGDLAVLRGGQRPVGMAARASASAPLLRS